MDPPYTGPAVRHYCLMAGITNFFGKFPNGSGEILVSLALFSIYLTRIAMFSIVIMLHISLQEKAQNNLIFFLPQRPTYFFMSQFHVKKERKSCGVWLRHFSIRKTLFWKIWRRHLGLTWSDTIKLHCFWQFTHSSELGGKCSTWCSSREQFP